MLTAPQFSPTGWPRSRTGSRSPRAGRGASRRTVRLLAVSKQQPATVVRAAAAAGQSEFGENYVAGGAGQDRGAARPAAHLAFHRPAAGQQDPRRRRAPSSGSTPSTARGSRSGSAHSVRTTSPPLDVLLQVKLADEPGKGGIRPAEVPGLAEVVAGLPRLRLRGLMCIPEPAIDRGRPPRRRSDGCGNCWMRLAHAGHRARHAVHGHERRSRGGGRRRRDYRPDRHGGLRAAQLSRRNANAHRIHRRRTHDDGAGGWPAAARSGRGLREGRRPGAVAARAAGLRVRRDGQHGQPQGRHGCGPRGARGQAPGHGTGRPGNRR